MKTYRTIARLRNLVSVAVVAVVLATIGPAEAQAACSTNAIRYKKFAGEKPLLVIAWDPLRPAPDNVRPSIDQIVQNFFGPGRSVQDYYFWQSAGKAQVTLQGIRGWYTSRYPASHYWNHPAKRSDGSPFDEFSTTTGGWGHAEKWAEAIRFAAADQFNFSFYDSNCDGELAPEELAIVILIPQQVPFGTNRFTISNAQEARLSVGGVKFQSIAEVYTGTDATGVPLNFGVTAHELGHLLFNFQDMYVNSAGSGTGGSYSLMDASYNDSLIDPWQKNRLGWMKVTNVTASGYYWLKNSMYSNQVLQIQLPRRCFTYIFGACIPMPGAESVLVENRQAGMYDRQLPTNGVAVWNSVDLPSTGNPRVDTNIINRNGLLNPRSILNVPYRDGTPSSVTVSAIARSGDSMQVYIHVP